MNAKVLVMAHLFKVKKKIKRAFCLNRVKKKKSIKQMYLFQLKMIVIFSLRTSGSQSKIEDPKAGW